MTTSATIVELGFGLIPSTDYPDWSHDPYFGTAPGEGLPVVVSDKKYYEAIHNQESEIVGVMTADGGVIVRPGSGALLLDGASGLLAKWAGITNWIADLAVARLRELGFQVKKSTGSDPAVLRAPGRYFEWIPVSSTAWWGDTVWTRDGAFWNTNQYLDQTSDRVAHQATMASSISSLNPGTMLMIDIESSAAAKWRLRKNLGRDHPHNSDVIARYLSMFLWIKAEYPEIKITLYGDLNPQSFRTLAGPCYDTTLQENFIDWTNFVVAPQWRANTDYSEGDMVAHTFTKPDYWWPDTNYVVGDKVTRTQAHHGDGSDAVWVCDEDQASLPWDVTKWSTTGDTVPSLAERVWDRKAGAPPQSGAVWNLDEQDDWTISEASYQYYNWQGLEDGQPEGWEGNSSTYLRQYHDELISYPDLVKYAQLPLDFISFGMAINGAASWTVAVYNPGDEVTQARVSDGILRTWTPRSVRNNIPVWNQAEEDEWDETTYSVEKELPAFAKICACQYGSLLPASGTLYALRVISADRLTVENFAAATYAAFIYCDGITIWTGPSGPGSPEIVAFMESFSTVTVGIPLSTPAAERKAIADAHKASYSWP